MIDMDNIKVVKEKRKSLAVEVYPNFTVLVKSPEQAKDFEIKDFIKRKTTWIEKQLNYFKQFNMPEDKVYESGSSALYLGRQYLVIIEKSPLRNIIKVLNNKIYILTPSPQKLDEINHALQNWFIRRGETIFNERLNFCMKAFPDLKMPKLKIRKLNKRWGSYLKKHEIVLNPALIKASKQSIDYAIYHELCHAYYPNHTDEFYNLLSLKMPNWEKIKEKMELKLLSY